MLNLENVKENISQLASAYNICVSNNHYLFDGDLEDLFSDSDITVGEILHKAKDWKFDKDGWLLNCEDGDYLETIELLQNGKVYLCQVFSERFGDRLDYALALHNIFLA